MKKLLICIIVLTGFISAGGYPFKFVDKASAQQKPIPPYAKWGTLAMEKTKERYPNANILDYLHMGRVPGIPNTTEKFKLWLKENNKEFGVFVEIQFDTRTEKVIKITFKETAR